jgi:acyl-CoA synthetase (AMP-forming)/AMP-acid ligase II
MIPQMPASSTWTVADCVAAIAVASPNRLAIELLDPRTNGVTPVETWTYGQVWARVEAFALAISQVPEGVHGPMVAIMMPNSVDHLAAYLACQMVGAAAVPINNLLAPPEVTFVIGDSGASMILAAEPFLNIALSATESSACEVLDVGLLPMTAATTWIGPSDELAADRVALVAYTSGTTGFPKGSTVTNEGLLTRLAQWSWTFGLHPGQVLSTPGPLFHMSYGGLSLAHLAAGGHNRIMTEFDPTVALVEYAKHSTWAFLVPAMTSMIVQQWRDANEPSLDALEWMLSSGAPGPMSLLDQAFDVFPNANIAEAYGWTEGGWVTFEVKDRDALVPHSVGWPVLGTEVSIRDHAGDRCPPGVAGEVVARSLTPFVGYLGNVDATLATITADGFCRSGDIGILRDDGRLAIVDRVKDMIITGGENVYSAEVERILLEHISIAEAAVIGLPDDTWGERVTAVIVPTQTEPIDLDQVRAHCQERLARYKCPREILVVDELPRNSMGKVQKFKLVAEHAS